jgi:thiopeptide-type bacteriocin biosynthesis protein
MRRLIFNSYLFLRTPALSCSDHKPSALPDLIKDHFFQSAIFFASESLYMELKRCNFSYDVLDNKVKLSLLKYLNRMCYRPTPFGMFSAFTSLNWNLFDDTQKCILDEHREVFINPDFQFTVEIARRMAHSGEFSGVKYFLNSTIYAIKGEKRYLVQHYDPEKNKTDFFIKSFDSNRILNKLISFCDDGRTQNELILWLGAFVDDKEEVKSYLNDLIEEGLLIPELFPNMSGEMYFERLVKIAKEHGNETGLMTGMLDYERLLQGMRASTGPDLKKLAENPLYSHGSKKFKSMFYVASERESGSRIDKKYQEVIKRGLECLAKINVDEPQKSLSNFSGKFRSRYEDQEIPILQALDHEAGIGYEGLENNSFSSELLDGIQLDLHSSSLNFNWTSVHEYFLSKLVEIKSDEPIIITDLEIAGIKDPSQRKIPPSFSVIFRLFGEKVWIELAGGCTATALPGRFTLFSDRVLEEVRYMAMVEEKSNEEVVFAEISCFHDDHSANINSNGGIRLYEIPIGVHSTYNKSNIIHLSDLLISVINNQIILRSKRLNKIVIPRLSSAFNYTRSELTVFRFLCDLQYQGLKSNFNFDLRGLLPGLKYYPRVEYSGCILFPATWILGTEEVNELSSDAGFINFCLLAKKIRLKQQFALTEGDNHLTFDKDDHESVSLFLQVIKNKQQVILQEAFIDGQSHVRDGDGKPFVGQFVAAVFADEVSYPQRAPSKVKQSRVTAKRVYLPGDEWIYFKLYGHPATANGILVKDIRRIIARLRKQNILKNWFFIRYADPETHLRVRLQINPKDSARVMSYFERSLRTQVERGSINTILLDTYKRELERYGNDTIEFAERIFCASSDLIVNYLKNIRQSETGFSELHMAIISLDALLNILLRENTEKIALLKLMHENMKQEFGDNKQLKFQLDSKYREHSAFFGNINQSKSTVIQLAGVREFDTYLKALKALKAKVQNSGPEKLMTLAGDIIHMQLNRLFNDRQRNHEFIIYYLLHKYYLSVEARKGKSLLSFSPALQGFGVNQVNKSLFK